VKTYSTSLLYQPLLAIISVQSGAAIAKVFSRYWCSRNCLLRMEFQLSYSSPFIDLIYSRLPKQWKVVIPYGLCLGAMNLIFYLAIERIPIGLAVTLEFIGPLLVAVFCQNVL
jgi:inner membrane transporter RhtA